jgi:hypothetical protein
VASRGAAPLLAGPIEPSDDYFPDAYAPSLDGARVVAERLLGYAGLGHLRCGVGLGEALETRSSSTESTVGGTASHSSRGGAAAWFAGIDGNTCHFGVEPGALHDPDSLVASLAHEVAHAFRAFHGLASASRVDEEQATDVTTVYLGFGIFTTNAADRLRTSGGVEGVMTVWRSSRQSLGYLPPQAFAFLLAAQAIARDSDRAELRRVRSRLETNQAASFEAAVRIFRRERTRLLQSLGLEVTCRGTPPPRPVREVAGLSREAVMPDPDALIRVDNRGRKTYRVTGRSHPTGGLVLLVCGIFVGALLWRWAGSPLWALVGIGVGLVLRAVLGGPRPDACSDPECQADLAPGLTQCPRCGGAIAGSLTDPSRRLDEPEEDDAADSAAPPPVE